jgi:DNA-binding transcriptional regulator GbsR (MarR family)
MIDIISSNPPSSYLGLSRTNISIIDVVRHNPGICNKEIIHSTGYVRSSVQEGLRELKNERNALQSEVR